MLFHCLTRVYFRCTPEVHLPVIATLYTSFLELQCRWGARIRNNNQLISKQQKTPTRMTGPALLWLKWLIMRHQSPKLSPFAIHKDNMEIAGSVKDMKMLESGHILLECAKNSNCLITWQTKAVYPLVRSQPHLHCASALVMCPCSHSMTRLIAKWTRALAQHLCITSTSNRYTKLENYWID